MSIKNTVGTLTSTAYGVVRHPLGTAHKATGLGVETAGAVIGLVRNRINGAPEDPSVAAAEGVDEAQGTASEVQESLESVASEVVDAAVEVKDATVEKTEDVVTEVQKAVPAKKAPAAKKTPAEKPAEKPAAKKASPKPAAKKSAEEPADHEDPRDHIPGPDLAPYLPPAPEDLPEPIVIVAE